MEFNLSTSLPAAFVIITNNIVFKVVGTKVGSGKISDTATGKHSRIIANEIRNSLNSTEAVVSAS